MSSPLAALTGASGGLAQSLLPRLLAQFRVRALFRRESELSREWAARGCEVVLGDLASGDALERLCSGAEVVVHAAAKILGTSRSEFRETNVEGTRRLIDHAARCAVRRLVQVSSIAVYDLASETPGDFEESAPVSAGDSGEPYGWSKRQAEGLVREANGRFEAGTVIVRPTCLYGPRLESWTRIPLRSIQRGRALVLGLDDGGGWMDAVAAEDVADGILLATTRSAAAGQVYNLGHERVTFAEFYGYLAGMAGRPPKLASRRALERMSRWTARIAARWPAAFGGLHHGLAMLVAFSTNTRAFPSDKARRELGYSPRIRLPLGMLRTEWALRESGVLPRGSRRLPNADRHYWVQPRALARPRDTEEVVAVVRESAALGCRIKAMGSLHSFAPIPDTNGVCVAMDRCAGVLAVEGTRVTVWAGTTLSRLNQELAGMGLALAGMGSHTAQTVSGAISTGTHGGSMRVGCLSDFVEALEWVTPQGEVRTVRRTELDSGFDAVVVSLGLLGVMTKVTLCCVPRYALRAEVAVKPLDAVLEGFDALQRGNEFVDLLYHPALDVVEVMTMNRADPAEVHPPGPRRSVSPGQRRAVSLVLRGVLKGLSLTRNAAVHRSFARRLIGTSHRPRVGWGDDVLAFTDLDGGEPFPIDDLEFGLRYENGVEALRELRAGFRTGKRVPRFFPVHIRCSAGGGHWLAPNHGRDTCWLEFWSHPPDPQLYRELHACLAPFGYRGHWGKILVADPGYVAAGYPRWTEFAKLRRDADPEGRWLNERTRPWFQA